MKVHSLYRLPIVLAVRNPSFHINSCAGCCWSGSRRGWWVIFLGTTVNRNICSVFSLKSVCLRHTS